jgi:hypothetical protein
MGYFLMPTFHIRGLKRRFYSHDHAPAHVHCINSDGVAVIEIASGAIRSVKGSIKGTDVSRAVTLVAKHRKRLLKECASFEKRRLQ